MKKVLGLFFLLFIGQMLWAQREYDDQIPPSNENEEFVGFSKKENRKVDMSRFLVGGTAGFGFYNGYVSFNVAPNFGYQIVKDRLEVGPGIIYGYARYKDRQFKAFQHTVGGYAYARVYIFKGVFAQVRGEIQKRYYTEINLTTKAKYNDASSMWNIFPGVGYSVSLGDRALVNMGLEINAIAYPSTYSNYERVISPFFNIQYRLGK